MIPVTCCVCQGSAIAAKLRSKPACSYSGKDTQQTCLHASSAASSSTCKRRAFLQ